MPVRILEARRMVEAGRGLVVALSSVRVPLKGECLRHYADEGIAQADRSIEQFRAKIEEHQRALYALKQLLQEKEGKKDEYLKRKWYRK